MKVGRETRKERWLLDPRLRGDDEEPGKCNPQALSSG